MKIRNGFVSNSSSTSYIVAVRRLPSDCPHCNRRDINLVEYLDSTKNDSDNSGRIVSNQEIMKDIASDEYRKTEEKITMTKKIQSYDDNWDFAYVSISYHDGTAQKLFENQVESGNIRIISDEN